MEEIIIAALKFYIQHLRLDIRHLDECGEDTGFLPDYLDKTTAALNVMQNKINS